MPIPSSQTHASFIRYALRILFFICVGLYGAIYQYEILYKTQSYTLFLNSSTFFHDTLSQPGGLLIYISRFLTQTGYYPWLGGLLLAILYSAMEWTIGKVYHIPSRLYVLRLLIPILLLVTISHVGYFIYTSFDGSFLFSFPIGILATIGIMACINPIKRGFCKIITGILLCLAGYLIFGVYALGGGLFSILLYFPSCSNKLRILLGGCGILFLGLIPIIAYHFLFYQPLHACFWHPLPDFAYSLVCYGVLLTFLTLGIFTLLRPRFLTLKDSPLTPRSTLWVILLLGVGFIVSYRDASFRAELKAQRLLYEMEWQKILDITQQAPPSRALSAYRAIALDYTGQLGNQLFVYPYAYQPHPVQGATSDIVYGRDLSLFASCVNNSYMKTMTSVVNYGLRPYDLQMYIRCALLNHEHALATRYLTLLNQTLFYKSWVKKHFNYVAKPETLYEDPLYDFISEYEPETNQLTSGGSNVVEYYLTIEQGSAKIFERFLMDCLYTKELTLFWTRSANIPSLFGNEIPVHIQEALALIDLIDGRDISAFAISEAIQLRTTDFVSQLQSFGNDFESGRTALEAAFGQTYGYYYFFRSLKEEVQTVPSEGSVN